MRWSFGLPRSLQVVSLPNQTPRETPGGISVPPRRIWRRGVGTGSVLQTAVGQAVIYGPGSCACSEIKLVLGVLLLGLEGGCQPSAVELGRVQPRSANPILTLCRIALPARGLFYPRSSPVILLSLFSPDLQNSSSLGIGRCSPAVLGLAAEPQARGAGSVARQRRGERRNDLSLSASRAVRGYEILLLH